MKKFFSLLLVCFTLFSLTTKAQATSLTIINNTPCPICFYVLGSKGPECSPITTKTGVICIPPGATVTYPNTGAAPFVPPLAPGGLFVGLCWFNHDPSRCADIPLEERCIYDRCAGAPQTDRMEGYGNDCRRCGTVTGTWTTVGSSATVVFN